MKERAQALAAPAAALLAGGVRDLELARSLPPGAPAPTAGEPLRLTDDRGFELGVALADPDNDRLRVFAVAAERFGRVDGALVAWRVERALAARRALGLGVAGDTTAYRIVHGAGDGLPGLTADLLGSVAVVWAYAPALLPTARLLAEALRGYCQLAGAVVKVRARGGGAPPQETLGEVAEALLAHELGAAYEVHPLGGLNVGLFTDMREQRRGLPRFAGGRAVLNLFSYTGALGLACARAGAASVVSVDTSAGVHAWAMGNFRRAGVEPGARFRFETGDAVRFLARAGKERERYDLVLIDPPTFSTARGAPWTLDRDYPALIAQACAVIPEGGLLWLAANTHELASLPRLASKGLAQAGRDAAVLEQGGLPPDYPTRPAQPRDRYLQTVLLRLG